MAMRSLPHLLHALAVACMLSGPLPARAVQPDEILADPALEERARHLSQELRCMVCQNQSIDDSDAPLARDLRVLVRDRLKAGDSDRQVLDFLTARYGDFVLLRPRLAWDTAVLWFTPAAVLVIGAIGLVAVLRRRRRGGSAAVPTEEPQLTAAERARLAELTGGAQRGSRSSV
jgi:cytochrome c-type biogenesis protein CcmH